MTTAEAETPLARLLQEEIRASGPMCVSQFMGTCLFHEQFGYYRRQQAIGRQGDFVTAPEISQIFGELIGLWCAVVWQQMREPRRLHLLELGPGRGTLMADVLRSARLLPAFRDALQVHLVEISETLRAAQAERLRDTANVTWHESWPDAGSFAGDALIVVGNEFLDALPIDQVVYRGGAWYWRLIGLDDTGAFGFVDGDRREFTRHPAPSEGDVREFSDAQDQLMQVLAEYGKAGPVAALFVDYGSEHPQPGDTLQGVRAHRYVSPFDYPGEADLTAQVDFSGLTRAAQRGGLVVDGVVTQAEFLGALGVVERASRLMSANPGRAGEIEAGVARLLAPNGMGTRFKAMGLRGAGLPPLPGFAVKQGTEAS